MASPELNAKIEIWRSKAIDGTLTQDEMREAILALRGERRSASFASEKSKTKKAAASRAPISADDLLSEIAGL